MTDRLVRVKVKNHLSTATGVPQELVLGPILYSLYTHDGPCKVFAKFDCIVCG